jgi:hypothetical protein
LLKYSLGYMNDSSYKNASDPNSMIDQGSTRNAVYNVRMSDVPPIYDSAYSRVLRHQEADKELLNRSFYAFGAQHTNLRTHFKPQNHSQSASQINRNFSDVKSVTMGADEFKDVIEKPANVVMNDYTKNISQSIFTPGVYKQTDKLTNMSR